MKTREDFSVGTFAVSLQEETLLATLLPERPLSLAVHESCPLAVSLSLAVSTLPFNLKLLPPTSFHPDAPEKKN